MRFASLASGSSGNAAFVHSGDTRILIDNGLSLKTLRERLAAIGERPEDIDAVVVTHAHGDHSNGLAVLIKESIRCGRSLPVWLSEGTAERIDWQGIECPPLICFDAGKSFIVGDIEVSSLTIPHDCQNPVGFVIADNRSRCGIATDLGFVPPAMISRFRACDLIMIESNHDLDMLAASDRTAELKARIGGRNGHLSNQATSWYLRHELSDNVREIILAHLSRETNTEQIAWDTAAEALGMRDMAGRLRLAFQDRGTGVIEI